MKKIIIAIDGHSSCGKSTLAKALGNALGYAYISTGDMYRAVTLYFIEKKVKIADPVAVLAALRQIRLHFENDGTTNRIFLNGRDVSEEIRKMHVAELVSPVAALPEVRREMVHQQQEIGKQKGIVMDGRDIGTVVFPDAELKIFLTADPDERARRRYDELKAKGLDVNFEEVKSNLLERDRIDSTRK
ncbi:MAG: (d)CMP kinase, partial [Bacteroidota bacterium]